MKTIFRKYFYFHLRSLEEDKYDHITATYFLIAERLLRKRYGSSPFHLKLEERRSYPYEETRSHRYAFGSHFILWYDLSKLSVRPLGIDQVNNLTVLGRLCCVIKHRGSKQSFSFKPSFVSLYNTFVNIFEP